MLRNKSVFHESVFESLFIELTINENEILVIGVLHRPPMGKLNQFEDKQGG